MKEYGTMTAPCLFKKLADLKDEENLPDNNYSTCSDHSRGCVNDYSPKCVGIVR